MSKIIMPGSPIGVNVRKRHITLDLWYEISVHDLKTGKRTRHRKGRCYSFVGYFVDLLNGFASGGGRNFDYTSYAGVSRTGNAGVFSGIDMAGSLSASSGIAEYGLVVGTGTTTPAITDTTLATPIAHGTSSGQLQHSAVSYGAPATLVGQTTFVVTRVFTNGSGAGITVKEIGMVVSGQNSSVSTHKILIARDTIADTLVPNGQALTLNYTFRTDV